MPRSVVFLGPSTTFHSWTSPQWCAEWMSSIQPHSARNLFSLSQLRSTTQRLSTFQHAWSNLRSGRRLRTLCTWEWPRVLRLSREPTMEPIPHKSSSIVMVSVKARLLESAVLRLTRSKQHLPVLASLQSSCTWMCARESTQESSAVTLETSRIHHQVQSLTVRSLTRTDMSSSLSQLLPSRDSRRLLATLSFMTALEILLIRLSSWHTSSATPTTTCQARSKNQLPSGMPTDWLHWSAREGARARSHPLLTQTSRRRTLPSTTFETPNSVELRFYYLFWPWCHFGNWFYFYNLVLPSILSFLVFLSSLLNHLIFIIHNLYSFKSVGVYTCQNHSITPSLHHSVTPAPITLSHGSLYI